MQPASQPSPPSASRARIPLPLPLSLFMILTGLVLLALTAVLFVFSIGKMKSEMQRVIIVGATVFFALLSLAGVSLGIWQIIRKFSRPARELPLASDPQPQPANPSHV